MRYKPNSSACMGAAVLVNSIGVLGLVGAGALAAADSGPRQHAEGQYDASTDTDTVVAGNDLTGIAERFGTTVALVFTSARFIDRPE